jgi:hypothetical protein
LSSDQNLSVTFPDPDLSVTITTTSNDDDGLKVGPAYRFVVEAPPDVGISPLMLQVLKYVTYGPRI